MAFSAETQAIIDRLKAEGDLIRNSGTNSIKATNIQLQKFEGLFNSISANITEQTKILQMQAGIAQEAIEVARTKEQLEEIKTKAEEQNNKVGNQSSKSTDDAIDRLGDKIEKGFSVKNAFGMLKDLAVVGAGGFVFYNLLKGFLNERTNGGFTRFEESMRNTNWTAMMDGINTVDWSALSTAINSMAAAALRFEEWLDGLPLLLLGGGIGGAIARGTARGLVEGAVGGGGAGPQNGRGGGMFRRLTSLRTTISGAVLGLTLAYGDEIHAWLTNPDNLGMSDGWASTTVDTVQVASGLATLSSLFGIGLASPIGIAAAAIGVAYVLGRGIYRWFQRQQELAEQEMNERLDNLNAIYDFEVTPETPASQIIGDASAVTPSINAQQALARATSSGLVSEETILAARNPNLSAEERTAAREEVTTAMETAVRNAAANAVGTWNTDIINALNSLDPNMGLDGLIDEPGEVDRLIGMLNGVRRNALADQAAGAEMATNPFAVFFNSTLLDRFPNYFQNMTRADLEEAGVHPDYLRLYDWYASSNPFQFKRGSRGFRDFGSATLSVLHGREAVVPYNSAAGRFLDQYFDGNWQPKVANARNLGLAASGGAGTMNIIQPVNIGGSTITMADGGKSVSMINVGGGGSASPGGSMLPYGLTGAFS